MIWARSYNNPLLGFLLPGPQLKIGGWKWLQDIFHQVHKHLNDLLLLEIVSAIYENISPLGQSS